MVYFHDYGVIKRKLSIATLLVIAGLFAFLASFGVFSNANATAETIVVTQGNMKGWVFAQDTNPSGTPGVGEFVIGPGTPVIGVGSARLAAVNSTEGHVIAKAGNNGTKLSDLSQLRYSTYRESGGNALAISLQLVIDGDLTDSNDNFQGRLVYEPYFTKTVQTGAWQEWDTLDNTKIGNVGNWWFSNGTLAGGPANCSQSKPCTWSEVKDAYPKMGINKVWGAVLFKAGTGWTNFSGNVDNLVIGVTDGVTIYDFEKDLTAPAAPTHVSPASGTVTTAAGLAKIDWNDVTDPSSPVKYYYQSSTSPATDGNGAFVSPAYTSGALSESEIPTPGTPEGTYYWHVRAVDAAGNSSAWSAAWTVTVDNTPPEAPTMGPVKDADGTVIPDGGFTNSYTATAYWTSVSDAAKYEYTYWNNALPGSPYGNANTPWTAEINGLAVSGEFNQGEGQHYLAVKAVDAAGNKSALSNTYTVFYDKTSPNTPGTPTTASPTNSLTQVWNWTAATDQNGENGTTGSGVDHYLVKVNDEAEEKVSAATFTTNLPVGNHTLSVQAVDKAGNVSGFATGNVTVFEYVKNKDQCKNEGWKIGYSSTQKFKNQGDCVSFFATNGKNKPSSFVWTNGPRF